MYTAIGNCGSVASTYNIISSHRTKLRSMGSGGFFVLWYECRNGGASVNNHLVLDKLNKRRDKRGNEKVSEGGRVDVSVIAVENLDSRFILTIWVSPGNGRPKLLL